MEEFRSLLPSDASAIAQHYNKNLEQVNPLWCGTGNSYSPEKVRLHSFTLSLRGKAITQVHTRNGEFISYFGGYIRGDTVTFKIGVINLDCDAPMDIWRKDAARLLQICLERGITKYKMSGSGEDGEFVSWIENEVGLKKGKGKNCWIGERSAIEKYVGGYMV